MIAHLRTIRVIKGKSFWLLFLSFVQRGRKKKNRVIKKKNLFHIVYCHIKNLKLKKKSCVKLASCCPS